MRGRTLSTGFLLLLLGGPALHGQQVGTAVRVVREAFWKVVGGSWSPLPVLGPVDLGWNLRTGRRSALVVTFRPHGFLQLGEKTRIVLDRSKIGQATGCDVPEPYALEGDVRIVHATPGATGQVSIVCGVLFASPDLTGQAKGTDIRLHVDPRLGTIVHVAQGEAVVVPRAREEEGVSPFDDLGVPRAREEEEIRVEAGQAILVAPDGSVSELPVPWDPDLAFPGFLDDPPLLEKLDPRTGPPK